MVEFVPLTAPYYYYELSSRTPRRRPAGHALQARAVAYQGEVAAFAAGIALVALQAGELGGFGVGVAGAITVTV